MSKFHSSDSNYIVVFDMDETLGHFTQLGLFWDIVLEFHNYINKPIDINSNNGKNKFFDLLNLFNKYLRPKIVDILELVKDKKLKGECDKVMIYTNNTGHKSWSNLIKEYFHKVLEYELFDQIIGAFKVNGKQIELCRTSYGKSVSDLINCSKLPENTQICFIDDQYHDRMENDNVVYLHIKPYVYKYNYKKMINDYYLDNKSFIDKYSDRDEYYKFFKNQLYNYKDYNKDYNLEKLKIEHTIDTILSKKIIEHLEDFFNTQKINYTRKKHRTNWNRVINKITRKIRAKYRKKNKPTR